MVVIPGRLQAEPGNHGAAIKPAQLCNGTPWIPDPRGDTSCRDLSGMTIEMLAFLLNRHPERAAARSDAAQFQDPSGHKSTVAQLEERRHGFRASPAATPE